MKHSDFEKLIETFYEEPNLERAVDGLQFYLSQTGGLVCGEEVLMPYFFGRLMQLHPEVAPRLRELVDETSSSKSEFIASLSRWFDDPAPENALGRVIQSPQDNDLLWIEFSLTGQPEPIIRLIDLFERADKVRGKLAGWLETPEPLLGRLFQARRRTCEMLQNVLDIHTDNGAGVVRSEDDLDALCFMRSNAMIDKQQICQMGKFFPISLSADEMNYCFTKATAKWSLCWSAIKNEWVRSIVTDQINERSGRALLTLLEIAARVSLATDDHPAAKDYLDRFLAMNPFRGELQGLRAPYSADAEIGSLSMLTQEAVKGPSNLEKADVKEIVRQCLANERSIQSGYGRLNAGIRKGDVFEDAEEQKYIECTHKFDASGSLDVLQWMDPDDWDKWISIDGKTYQSVGIWFETKDAQTMRSLERANSMLRNAGWKKVLEAGSPNSFDEYTWRGRQFLKIGYESPLLHSVIEKIMSIQSINRHAQAAVEIWVDLLALRMVVCDAHFKNVVLNGKVAHLALHQVFVMPNAIVTIDHPEVLVAPPGSGIEPGMEFTIHEIPPRSKLFESQ